mgnify:CR=1 FL=1
MTYTWKDVGDRPDKVLSQSEKEKIAAEWNDYEKNTKPALDLQSLREARDRRLAVTDWMCFPDSPTMSDAWKKYRQDLRDITKTATSLDDVKWPTKPE